jgi:hypothetical protein
MALIDAIRSDRWGCQSCQTSTHPNRDPSSEFVNEHAFALKELVEHAIITTEDEKEYSLAPHSLDALPLLLEYLRAGEPRRWIPSGDE